VWHGKWGNGDTGRRGPQAFYTLVLWRSLGEIILSADGRKFNGISTANDAVSAQSSARYLIVSQILELGGMWNGWKMQGLGLVAARGNRLLDMQDEM
jgi:hypothetical protein